MLIVWLGPKNRIRVHKGTDYQWRRENDFLQEVIEADVLADLLTQAGGSEFMVHQDDPLRDLVPHSHIVEMTFAGIVSLADLAAVEDIAAVLEVCTAGEEQVSEWIARARDLPDGQEVGLGTTEPVEED